MKTIHFFFLAPLLFACLIFVSCPPGQTNSNNTVVCACENGCCDKDGNCHAQPNKNYCGPPGEKCNPCTTAGYVCNGDGECLEESTTTPPPPTCTNCAGCCDSNSICITNLNDEACGSAGTSCDNCNIKGLTCNLATQACVSNDPCNNRCANEVLENGTICPFNKCHGCCRTVMENSEEMIRCLPIEQQSVQACGRDSQLCEICNSNIPCTNGACSSTCSPNCNGRCKGIDDGCGGKCSQACAVGCCSNSGWCSTNDDPLACGSSGDCLVCDTNTQICNANKCVAKTCNATTCAGCCNRYTGKCITPGTLPEACGLKGNECQKCKDQCQDGSCVASQQATYQIKVTNIHTNPKSTVRFYWNTDLENDYVHSIDVPPGQSITTDPFTTAAGLRTVKSKLLDLATVGQMCTNDPGFSGVFDSLSADIGQGKNHLFEYTTLADAKYNVTITNKTQSTVYVAFHSSRHPAGFSCPITKEFLPDYILSAPGKTTYYSAWAENNIFYVAWSTSTSGPWQYKNQQFVLSAGEQKSVQMDIP